VHVTPLTQCTDEDDQWSDVTSSEGDESPSKGVQNVDGVLDMYELPEEDTIKLLPYSLSSGLPDDEPH